MSFKSQVFLVIVAGDAPLAARLARYSSATRQNVFLAAVSAASLSSFFLTLGSVPALGHRPIKGIERSRLRGSSGMIRS